MFLSATEAPAGEKKEFAPHPKGPCKGVCVEVVTTNKKTGEPFSKVSQEGETKNQMILVFQTDKQTETEDGPQYNVHWEWFNIPQSITNENGKLHKFLKDWEVEIKDYPTQEAFAEEVMSNPTKLRPPRVPAEGNSRYNRYNRFPAGVPRYGQVVRAIQTVLA